MSVPGQTKTKHHIPGISPFPTNFVMAITGKRAAAGPVVNVSHKQTPKLPSHTYPPPSAARVRKTLSSSNVIRQQSFQTGSTTTKVHSHFQYNLFVSSHARTQGVGSGRVTVSNVGDESLFGGDGTTVNCHERVGSTTLVGAGLCLSAAARRIKKKRKEIREGCQGGEEGGGFPDSRLPACWIGIWGVLSTW